jgi:predicted HNH restriction endonuclease
VRRGLLQPLLSPTPRLLQWFKASNRDKPYREQVAKTSLDTDHMVYGDQLERLIPDAEGKKCVRRHLTHERSSRNRALAIQLRGRTCEVCEFNFDKVYGSEHADGYIQIHHIKPSLRTRER